MKATFFFRSVLMLCLLAGTGEVYGQKKTVLTEEQQVNFERFYLNGAREKILKNNDEAIRQFNACLAIDPGNAAVYYNLAELYFDKKLLEDAQQQVEKAILLDKQNLWYRKLLGEIYEVKQEYELAGDIAMYLSEREDQVDYLAQAAYLYSICKEYGKAIKALDLIEKKAGLSEEVIRQKEQVYLAANKLDKAIAEVLKLTRAYPRNTRYKGMLADLYMANGKTDKAVVLYLEILKAEPGNGSAAFAMSDYYRETGEKEKWFDMMKTGMGSADVDVKSKLRMMVSFTAAKMFDNNAERAAQLADAFIKAHPNDATVYLVKGDLFTEEKKFAEAHDMYHKALLLDPSPLNVWQQMIFCSSQLQDNALIQKDCEEAMAYFPNDPLFYLYHARVSMQLKQYEKAAGSAKKGIELSEDSKERQVDLYIAMGDAYHYLKNEQACDSAYEQALKLDSVNAYALNNYAYFLSLRKEKLARAESMSKKSIELDPGNASYLDTYGWILYQQKDYLKAKEYISRSLSMVPDNAEVTEHLGDVLFRLDEKEKAVESWKRAKELGSEGEFLERKIKDKQLHE